MKKVNFNSLENFEVPEEWIEKALNAKPKKKPLLLRPYVLGTAASVVLVAAVSLLMLKPFGGSNVTPIAVSTTAPSEATQPSTAPTKATEEATAPQTEPSTGKREVPSTVQTEPITQPPTEAPTEPETVPPTDDPSKFRIKSDWELDLCLERSDGAMVSPDSSLLLSESELFKGDITVEISSDSRFYDHRTFCMELSGYYKNSSEKIGGTVILEPQQTEDGKKSVTFNIFKEREYIPSADYTIRIFAYNDNGSKTEKTLTEKLYSNNSVKISI